MWKIVRLLCAVRAIVDECWLAFACLVNDVDARRWPKNYRNRSTKRNTKMVFRLLSGDVSFAGCAMAIWLQTIAEQTRHRLYSHVLFSARAFVVDRRSRADDGAAMTMMMNFSTQPISTAEQIFHISVCQCVCVACVFIIFGLVCVQMNFPHNGGTHSLSNTHARALVR